MASSSLIFPSLSLPKVLSLSERTSLSFSLPFSCSSLRLRSYSISVSHSSKGFLTLPSRFVRNVALSSDFDQEEEVLGDEDEKKFSPDLKLFVGNLPFSVDSAGLAGLFAQAGSVEMVEVIYDKVTGRSRGFGFVTMSSVEDVEAAAQKLNGYELEGRQLRVNSGPPPARRESTNSRGLRGGTNSNSANRLYIGNLSWGVDDLALETLFSGQGKVTEARVIYDRDSGRSRGFGFVTYSSAEEANSAIEYLDGVDLNGRAIRVTMAEAKPRREF